MALEVSSETEELAKRMLFDAYQLVLSGWCQGAGARDEMGRAIEPSSAFARRWSAPGALERIWRREDRNPDAALEAFERANLALAGAVKDVPERWNDAPARTHEEVLSALLDAQRYIVVGSREPLVLLEDLLDGLDRPDPIPGYIFEQPA